MMRETYERRMRTDIAWLDSMLVLLARRAEACAGRRKEDAYALLADLRQRRAALGCTIVQLATKQGSEWESIRTHADLERITVLQDIGRALRSVEPY